ITTRFYPSNWELSAARAASVVRLLERRGIASPRLSAVGYGAHRPIASNDSAEARAKNRRAAMVVLADKHVAHLLDERLRQSVSADIPAAVSTVHGEGAGAPTAPAGAAPAATTESPPGAGAADPGPPAAAAEKDVAAEVGPVAIVPAVSSATA